MLRTSKVAHQKHERIQDPKCSQTRIRGSPSSRIHGSPSSVSLHKQYPVDSRFRMDEQAWERVCGRGVIDLISCLISGWKYYGAYTEWTTGGEVSKIKSYVDKLNSRQTNFVYCPGKKWFCHRCYFIYFCSI